MIKACILFVYLIGGGLAFGWAIADASREEPVSGFVLLMVIILAITVGAGFRMLTFR